MKILGIETSTRTGSVALMDEERLIAEYTLNLSQTHTSRLMPAIDQVLKDACITINQVDGIAVSLGPGSFTGLRIGISTAKGLAQALSKPIVGIPTLDGLAFNLPYTTGIICPILDARKGEVYAALYESPDGNLKRLSDYVVCGPGKLMDELQKFSASTIIFLGDGVERYGGLITKSLGKSALFAPKAMRLASAGSIAELGLKKLKGSEGTNLFKVRPLYLRLSDAELKWQER